MVRLSQWQDSPSFSHSGFVSEYSLKIAQQLGVPQQETQGMMIASLLHDVGLLGLPSDIRKKPLFRLSQEERKVYQHYCDAAIASLQTMPILAPYVDTAFCQYEYLSGDPVSSKGALQNLSLRSKIVKLLSDYHYVFHGKLVKMVSGYEHAKAYLLKYSGKRYDAQIIKVFLELIKDSCFMAANQELKTAAMLRPGMVLQDAVVSPQGVVLLAKGALLNDSAIERLIRFEEDFKIEFEIVAR